MDAERKAWLRRAAEGNGDIYTIEALDALDAAEARVDQHFECMNAALDKLHAAEAELERLRQVRDAAEAYRQLVINERDNGIGELEARARLFEFLKRTEVER